MARKHLIGRFARHLACALFLLALAGCASVEVDRAPAAAAQHPAIAEAQALARKLTDHLRRQKGDPGERTG